MNSLMEIGEVKKKILHNFVREILNLLSINYTFFQIKYQKSYLKQNIILESKYTLRSQKKF